MLKDLYDIPRIHALCRNLGLDEDTAKFLGFVHCEIGCRTAGELYSDKPIKDADVGDLVAVGVWLSTDRRVRFCDDPEFRKQAIEKYNSIVAPRLHRYGILEVLEYFFSN
jgi:hypothetical protein